MIEITRSRWAAVGAAVAVALGAGGIGLGRAAVSTGEKPVYVALAEPCRVVDTRPATQIGPKGSPIAAGEANAYEIQITGGSGECVGALAVPGAASAVALNVTAIAPVATATGRSFFTVHPAGTSRPGTSNLNFLDGAPPTPNKVDVGLSGDGRITIYNNEGTAHAAVDVFGYYIDHHHDDRYYTKTQTDAALASSAQGARSVVAHSSTGGAIDLEPARVPLVARTVSLVPPSDGTVVVDGWAVIDGPSGEGDSLIYCSINTAASTDPDFEYRVFLENGGEVPVVLSRAYDVSAGVSFTVNLVCEMVGGVAEVRSRSLIATFVPD